MRWSITAPPDWTPRAETIVLPECGLELGPVDQVGAHRVDPALVPALGEQVVFAGVVDQPIEIVHPAFLAHAGIQLVQGPLARGEVELGAVCFLVEVRTRRQQRRFRAIGGMGDSAQQAGRNQDDDGMMKASHCRSLGEMSEEQGESIGQASCLDPPEPVGLMTWSPQALDASYGIIGNKSSLQSSPARAWETREICGSLPDR